MRKASAKKAEVGECAQIRAGELLTQMKTKGERDQKLAHEDRKLGSLSEVEYLRTRVDQLVAKLEHEFPKLPKTMLSRVLLAKGANISLADVGALGTIWATQRMTDLLAGRWSEESELIFISTRNY